MSIFKTPSEFNSAPNLLSNSRPFDITGSFQSGIVTRYGPNPLYIHGSEVGYQPNAVGVGCSNGSNDPNWTKILAKGVYNVSSFLGMDKNTVWPRTPTIAVSQFAWNRNEICWKTVKIRNALNHSLAIEAVVVDFCPTSGCLWNPSDRAWNADIYGVISFQALGGEPNGGSINVEIAWPAGIKPDTSDSSTLSRSLCSLLFLFLLSM